LTERSFAASCLITLNFILLYKSFDTLLICEIKNKVLKTTPGDPSAHDRKSYLMPSHSLPIHSSLDSSNPTVVTFIEAGPGRSDVTANFLRRLTTSDKVVWTNSFIPLSIECQRRRCPSGLQKMHWYMAWNGVTSV